MTCLAVEEGKVKGWQAVSDRQMVERRVRVGAFFF